MICSKCGKTIGGTAKICGYCGARVSVGISDAELHKRIPKMPSLSQTVTPSSTGKTTSYLSTMFDSTPKCPVCGSTSIQAMKKGYSVGKAAVGAVLAGPVGLAAGAIGMNNVQRVCLKCGHKF